METISSPNEWKSVHATLEHLNLIGITIDTNLVIKEVNPFLLRKTNWTSAELINRDFVEVLIPELDRNEIRELLEDSIFRGANLERHEIIFLSRSGSLRTMVINSALIQNNQGLIESITLIGEDITRRRRTEAALSKSNTQLLDLVDNTSDLIQLITLDGKFIFVNKEWGEVLGYSLDEISTLTIHDILAPEAKQQTLIQLRRIQQGLPMADFETVFLSRDGRKIFLRGSVNCRFDNGKPTAFRCILHDFTEKIRAEKAQSLYYSIANWTISTPNLDDLYHNIHHELGKIIDARNFFIALYEPSKSFLYFPYYVDEYFQKNVRFTKRRLGNGVTEYAIASNKPLFLYDTDIEALGKDKSIYLYGVTPKMMLCVPLRIGDRITGIIGVKSYESRKTYDTRDLELLEFISGQIAQAIARKQSEEELNKYSARLNSIFESSTHLIWSVNKSLQLTSFNQNYANLIDERPNLKSPLQSSTERLGWKMIGPANRRLLESRYRQTFKGEPQYFEMQINTKDDEEIWLEFNLSPIKLSDGVIQEISGIARDITRRKQAEIALLQSEETFRGIFENLQDIYIRTNRKGIITMVSPSVYKRSGYLPAEVLGRHITDFFTDTKLIHKSLIKLRRDKSLRNIEASLKIKDGSERQFMFNMLLFSDEKGKPTEVAVLARDISELKRNEKELRKAKEQAERSLKVKEGFLANMSHEIRTPMNGVIGMIDLLSSTRLSEEQRDYVTTIKRSSETLLHLLNDILDLSKIEAGKMELHEAPVSLSDLLEKVVSLFSQTARNKANVLTYRLARNLPANIVADQTRLLQILSNLTSNALKFTENGTVHIEVRQVSVKGNKHTFKIEVTDSGIGIEEEDQKLLFTSFTQVDNSSRKSFGGTGLGLAISKQLCHLMNGDIGVNSKTGEGSTFWFTFDAEKTDAAPKYADEAGGETVFENAFTTIRPYILLVDDNAVNRKVAGEILKKSGCDVDHASSGFEAIRKVEEAFKKGEKRYDIIFMDIQMPDMDGVQATRELRTRFNKRLPPVVAMTAYSMKEDRDRFLSEGMDDYLPKPIRAQQLIAKVQELTSKHKPLTKMPPAEEAQISPVLDREIVDQLKSIGGEDMVRSVYEDFVTESAELISEAMDAYERQDIPVVKSNLHTLKGSAGTVGASHIALIATEAELRLKTADTSALPEDMPQLRNAFQQFIDRHQALLDAWL